MDERLELRRSTSTRKAIDTRYFGSIDLADGETVLLDGGVHGIAGHTVRLRKGAGASWERRVDGLRPTGVAGAGPLALDAHERELVGGWIEQARLLADAGGGVARYFPTAAPSRPSRWVWAIVGRRGTELFILEGGGDATEAAPHHVAPLLAWMRRAVDTAAQKN